MRTARLLITHLWCPEVELEVKKLIAEDGADTWLLLDARTPGLSGIIASYPCSHVFSPASFAELPYARIKTGSLIGHGHFPILEFFIAHPCYDYYWFIEFDVRYTGRWGSFFSRYALSKHDLITAHIRRFGEEPWWPWWPTFGHPTLHMPVRGWLRSFNVIYRISNSALRFLDYTLRDGWHGHHEVLVATLLFQNRFNLLDFGGDGCFADPATSNVVYTSRGSQSGYLSVYGTLRFRPSRTIEGVRPNMLYHPVKPASAQESFATKMAAYRRWHAEHEDEWRTDLRHGLR